MEEIRGTLNRDDVNGDVEVACQQLQKFQAMENSKDMSLIAVGGDGPTGTGQEKSSTVADSRGKTNEEEIPKEQEKVKEQRNLTADSFGDYNLGQNGAYPCNRGQITRPSGEFKERPGEEPREGPRGVLAQSQSSIQGFKDNDMGMSQVWGVGLGHAPKPKPKSRDRGYRGRGRGFQDVNQLGGDTSSQSSQRQRYSEGGVSQQNQGKRGLHGGKAAQLSDFVDSNPPRNSTCSNSSVADPSRRCQGNQLKPRNGCNRGRGQRGTRNMQNLSGLKSSCHPEAIEQSRFQQNQLLVSGLSALTTEDCLVNFIEAMSGGEVEDIMMRNDKAVITMANDIIGKPCQGVTTRFISWLTNLFLYRYFSYS